MAAVQSDLDERLTDLGVDFKYHALIAELAGGSPEYLGDVVVEDLHGREDAEGASVTLPIARGLVRKLHAAVPQRSESPKQSVVDSKALEVPALMRSASREAARSADHGCSVSLLRRSAAATPGCPDNFLVRCCLRGRLPSNDGEGRRKILAIVLDQSGSMAGAMWRRVVEAVVGMVTDDLLQDPRVSIAFVVYSDEAREVRLPSRASELRDLLLSPAYSPRGGTSFTAAFRLARQSAERLLARHTTAGVGPKDVDIATLLFTDGEDTSVKGRPGRHGIPLVDKEASSRAARAAGDAFREALRRTGCPTYTCIAAFGADHDPDQCQYLSDRYYYINRGEVLAEVLAGGLGALLSSAGQCSLRLRLPPGVDLEELLPEALPLDSEGCLDHHVWLRAGGGCEGTIAVDVEVAGSVVLQGGADFQAASCAPEGSFEDHLFLVDLMGLQLRRVARELCGKASLSAEQLSALRARLTSAKDRLQPTKDLAGTARGSLRGRAALRERLAEVEASRERLSYALGQFDESDVNDQRTIGTVAIDAILRDAGQHVPQGPAAAALARQVGAAAELPAPEELSKYGRDYTTDAYSCCDAWELASQGDALFFQLGGVKPAPEGGYFTAEDGEGLVSHEAFVLLSGGGKQAIKSASGDSGFTHCGIPLYATHGHFLRARMLLPEALQRLTATGLYKPGESERQLLSLLGRGLAKGQAITGGQAEALLHKARAVYAVLSCTKDSQRDATLLETVVAESKRFLEDASARAEAKDLFAVAAGGLLAEDWDEAELAEFGKAVVAESLRRRLAHALRGAGEAQRLCLAWAFLGPADADAGWMDKILPCPEAGELSFGSEGFDPFTAPDELEALDQDFPAQAHPRPAGVAALLSILSAKHCGTNPAPQTWSALRLLLPAWGHMVKEKGGIQALWQTVDALMVDSNAVHQQEFQHCIETLRGVSPVSSLKGAFPDADAVLAVAISACLPSLKAEHSLRLNAAAALRAVVERRKVLVCKYPIVGADFPRLDSHTGETVSEVWGAPANPTDRALHHKAMLRVCRRTMKARITMTVKEALADKEYRKRGGKFAFPSPMDTFIRGLHRRTEDLHKDWRQRLQKQTSGEASRSEAVAEMLLRLRWDDSNDGARTKLLQIVARIWDGLEGVDLAGKPPLSSALWLHDAGDAIAGCEKPSFDEAAQGKLGDAKKPAPARAPPGLTREDGEVAEEDRKDHGEEEEVKKEDVLEAEAAEPESPGDDRRETQESMAAEEEGAAQPSERRAARDGGEYTHAEFSEFYGEQRGEAMWHEAQPEGEEVIASAAAAADGAENDDRQARAEAARAAMDSGLQASLDGLPAELRRRMDVFAADMRPGSRWKLPLSLRAKQRKAIHLWAEMQGLAHKSFGYRGRRRLHLSVEGGADAGGAAEGEDGEEFDFAAWASDQDEADED